MRWARPTPRRGLAVAAIITLAIAAVLAPHQQSPEFLYNDSPSVPMGFWIRANAPVKAGVVIAFHPPAAALPYVRAHMPSYAKATLIIKYVAAVAGDTICRTQSGYFTVNGATLGRASLADTEGNPLPAWAGCDRLADGEVAVFSDRIPNSFDSRYYGAIPASAQRGTYRPFWVW